MKCKFYYCIPLPYIASTQEDRAFVKVGRLFSTHHIRIFFIPYWSRSCGYATMYEKVKTF